MMDSVEQRLRDLEALVVRQAERIDNLEGRLPTMTRVAVCHLIKTVTEDRKAA